MKFKYLFLLSIFLIMLSACNTDEDTDSKSTDTVLHTTLPDIIGGNKLQGYIEDIDSSEYITYSKYDANGAIITSPAAAHIRVDGYVKVEGKNESSDTVYLALIKNNHIHESGKS